MAGRPRTHGAVRLLALGALLAGSQPATAATVPGLVTVTTPGHAAVVPHQHPVTIVLRHAGGVRVDGVELNGRAVTPRRTRLDGGRLRLVLGADTGLRPGRNTVAIRSRRGGDTDLDVVGVTRARDITGLAAVAAPSEGARAGSVPVRVVLAVPRRATVVRLWLNGRAVPESQWERRWRSGRIRLDLTASDGLRHGRNVLRVVASHGATRQEHRRSFQVVGSVPLAAPGPDRTAHAGARVTLDGRRSLPVPSRSPRVAADLGYQWQVVSAPAGSTARLDGDATATPTLVTDVPGTYSVALAVNDGTRRSASATTNISVAAPGLIPVAVRSTDLTVSVGGVEYPADPSVPGAALHYVAFDRRTGTPLQGVEGTLHAGPAAVKAYTSTVAALGSDALLVTAVSADVAASPAGRTLVAAVGGTSAVAVPGRASWASQDTTLSGYLATGGDGELTFTFGDYRPFTLFSTGTASTANTVNIDGVSYPAALPATAVGGFQLLRLDPVTLEPVSNAVVVTRTRRGSGTVTDTTTLANALGNPGVGDDLVFLASLGDPGPTPLPAGMIERVGGTPSALSDMTTGDRYGLVYTPPEAGDDGPGAAIEVGDVIDRDPSQALGLGQTVPPVQISGHLARRADGLMEPAAAVTGPESGIGFAPVVYRPAVQWPNSSTPGQLAALAWIAQRLQIPGDDPRAVYLQRNIAMGPLLTQLMALTFPGEGNGFAQADFDAVTGDLSDEFMAVANVRITMDGITATFSGAGLQSYADIATISSRVQKAVQPPPVRSRFNVMRAIGGGMLAAGKLASGPAAQGLGFAGEVLTVASELSHHTPGADPRVVVSDDATALQEDIPARINDYIANLGGIEDAIVTDRGRLMEAQDRIMGGEWAWSNTIAGQTQRAFRVGIARESWASLVGTVYTTYRLDPAKATKRYPNGGMFCVSTGYSGDEVYATTPPPVTQTWVQTGTSGRVGRVIARTGHRAGMYVGNYRLKALPPDLATPLFTPQTGSITGDLDPVGYYPPHFAAALGQKTMSCAFTPREARAFPATSAYFVLIR